MEDHVHWKTGMGAWVLINARWHKGRRPRRIVIVNDEPVTRCMPEGL